MPLSLDQKFKIQFLIVTNENYEHNANVLRCRLNAPVKKKSNAIPVHSPSQPGGICLEVNKSSTRKDKRKIYSLKRFRLGHDLFSFI